MYPRIALGSFLLAGCAGSGDADAATVASPDAPDDPEDPPAASPDAPVDPEEETGSASPAPGPNGLAYDLYGQLRPAEDNFVFSPTSIAMAFTMTYAGARGGTAEQMRSALRISGDADSVHRRYGALVRAWNDPAQTEYDLRVANRLFVQRSLPLEDRFAALTADHYRSEVQKLDFRSDPEGSRTAINRWVESQTEDRIPDLLPAGSITPDSRLVLTNAVYFDGTWSHTFDPERTADASFHRLDGSSVSVPMMRQKQRFEYAQIDGVELLQMPYRGEDFAMTIILPSDPSSLGDVEREIVSGELETWTQELHPVLTYVQLPRFELEPAKPLSLRPAFEALGMPLPFTQAADFGGIADVRPLFIADAYHKAFIRVDETGTEAAAATGVVMTSKSISKTERFVVDRPFVFAIRHLDSGAVMFLGRVSDPS